jgi:geranylgeranyl diphosphate synthase, type II
MNVTNITNYQALIEEKIKQRFFDDNANSLEAPIQYILSLGGKRIRPILTLMACELFEGNVHQSVNAALAIEVFHNFTLLHDDIMDKAPIRRGKPTVHEKWNESKAILSGDAMLIHAYKLLMEEEYANHLVDILNLFNQTALEVCQGQQSDMDFEVMESVSVDEYLEMIRLKTAVLLGAALELGAILADSSLESRSLIYQFGQNLGLAFQLRDDLLDVFGEQDKVGKQEAGDILSNKKTYLYLKALEIANEQQRDKLRNYYASTEFDNQEKITAVKAIFSSLGVPQIAEQLIEDYHDKSIRSLMQIEASDEKKKPLLDLAKQLFVREY